MSVVSADDDDALLLLAVMFEGDDGVINWDRLMNHLSPSGRSAEDLEERLEFLTRTDTTLLQKLPADFVSGTRLQRPREAAIQRSAYEAIEEVFGHFTQVDVRQPSGQQHLNAGEIAPVGVTAILEALHVDSEDVFVDIGSGTGSILAQLLLQTPASQAIGLEIRPDLAQKSRDAFDRAKSKYPRLQHVMILTGDVKCLSDVMKNQLSQATIVYSNNAIFQPEDNLDIHRLVCSSTHMGRLHTVILSMRFCSRCSHLCVDKFCNLWAETKVVMAKTCWKEPPVAIYVYRRKKRFDSLLALVAELM